MLPLKFLMIKTLTILRIKHNIKPCRKKKRFQVNILAFTSGPDVHECVWRMKKMNARGVNRKIGFQSLQIQDVVTGILALMMALVSFLCLRIIKAYLNGELRFLRRRERKQRMWRPEYDFCEHFGHRSVNRQELLLSVFGSHGLLFPRGRFFIMF